MLDPLVGALTRARFAPSVLVVLCLALTAASASSATSEAHAAEAGIAPDLTWATTPQEQDRAIAALKDLGVRWVRLTVEWRSYEPSDDRYDPWWQAHVDRAVDLAHQNGIKVVMVPSQSPQWASGSSNVQAPPRDPATFADFLRYAAARYAGKVEVWEIWNEQNTARFWPSAPDPRAYAALLRAAYPAVKQGDPSARVMFGGVAAASRGARQFVLDALAAGAAGYFDLMGWHPYTYMGESPDVVRYDEAGRVRADSFTGYRQLRADLQAHGSDRPIWLTEFGWTTSTQRYDPNDGDPWTSGVSEGTQAEYLRRAFEILAQDPYVEVAIAYNLRNNYWSHDADDVESQFGLMRTDWTPKAGYTALKAIAGGQPAPTPPANRPPSVQLTSPAAGRQFRDRLSLAAKASDDGGVSKVEFRVDGRVVAADSSAPYAFTWKVPRSTSYGSHRATARAYDAAGAWTEASTTITRTRALASTATASSRPSKARARRRTSRRGGLSASRRTAAGRAAARGA